MKLFVKILPVLLLGTSVVKSKIIVNIDKAIEKKWIKSEVVCKGGLCVDYKIKNQLNDSIQVLVPAGWRMNSVKEEYQDILITHQQILTLGGIQQKIFELKGYCCEADHRGPVKGALYEPGKMADSNLVKIATFLNKYETDQNTEQYAVWAISNNKPTANITSKNDSLTTLLRHFVAGVKGEPIPWYTLHKIVKINTHGDINEYPVSLNAEVKYEVDKPCYAWFYITDSTGVNKFGIIKGQWLNQGNNDYTVNLNIKEFKKGVYKLVLASEDKEFISRYFEI